jgi:hypothetical protein
MAKKLKRNVVLDHLEELRWLLVEVLLQFNPCNRYFFCE